MKKVTLAIIVISLFSLTQSANGKLRNKQEADEFLREYCIELITSIKDSYLSQKEAIKSEDWKTFSEKSRWIHAVSEVYSKLCK